MPTKPIRERVSERSRADLLAEIADLPPSAFIPTAHAAAYLGIHSRRAAELAVTAARAAVPRQKRIRPIPDFGSRPVDVGAG